MARLAVVLLGSLQVTRGGEPVRDFGYDKVRALLAFLAVEADRPHRREELAALLWPEADDEAARHGLRQALATLRRAIGEATADSPSLLVMRDAIGFDRSSELWVDVSALEALLDACDRHPHRHADGCVECAQRLEEAVALYRGDFLTGFAPALGATFEEWALSQRERLRRRVLEALARLGAYHLQRGKLERARDAIERQLVLDPWRESAHRELMRIHWQRDERAAALAQYDRCRRSLADELGVEPEAETTALWEEIRAGRPAAFAGARFAGSPRRTHGLPQQPTPLIGRERELEEIAALLANPDCRLLTLVGPGGIGKTRLAIATAADHATQFAGGAVFVPLAPVQAATFVAPAIVDALGLPLHTRTDPKPQLLTWLRDRELLLVLDNVEHLLAGAEVIAEILAAARDVTVLATSRERLHLRGEWVFPVEGLAVPKGDGTDGFEGYGAIQLCVQGLRRARPRTSLRTEERRWVVEICRSVEGMPLAIELAAAWGATLTLSEIAREIERSLDFLVAERGDDPRPHHSMRAVFDHSWDLLSDEERRVFCRLAVFRGGFARAAAEELAAASPSVLAALVGKSFVRVLPSGRYDLHELLRQYGEARLAADSIEHRLTHDRHCAYYLDFLRRRETALTGRDQRTALAEIAAEIGNIRAAWKWATARARVDEIAGAAHGLWLFYTTRGWVWEGAAAFGGVVAELADRGESAEVDPAARDLALGAALTRLGSYRARLGKYDEARMLLGESTALLRGLDAPRELGLALNFLALVAHAEGDYDGEQAILAESLVQFRAVDDAWGAGYSLNDLGMVAHLRGDEAEAARLSGESLAIFRQIGDLRGQGLALNNLGVVAVHRGENAEAERLHRASLALRRETEDQWGIASSLVQLGSLARLEGKVNEAETSLREALRTALDGEVQPVALEALVELAELKASAGEEVPAREILTAVGVHAAAPRWLRERAGRLLHGLAQSPAAGADEAIEEREAERMIAALVTELLHEDSP
jgi:predicted ATPase/DNA-binding SARP family transcriptional activator